MALKLAVDAWASAPADQEVAAFAAAEAVRWTEIGVNSFSFLLLGLTFLLYGLALASGTVYPRWAGWVALSAGAALAYHGAVVVAYDGFAPSSLGLVGLLLVTAWAFIMAVLMWRNGGRQAAATPEEFSPPGPSRQPASTG